MFISKANLKSALTASLLIAVLSGSLQAQVAPDRSGVGQAEFRLNELTIENEYRQPNGLPAQASPERFELPTTWFEARYSSELVKVCREIP